MAAFEDSLVGSDSQVCVAASLVQRGDFLQNLRVVGGLRGSVGGSLLCEGVSLVFQVCLGQCQVIGCSPAKVTQGLPALWAG